MHSWVTRLKLNILWNRKIIHEKQLKVSITCTFSVDWVKLNLLLQVHYAVLINPCQMNQYIYIYGKLLKVLANKMRILKGTSNRNNDMCLTEDELDWSFAKLFLMDPRKLKIQLPWAQPYSRFRCATRIFLGQEKFLGIRPLR